MYSTPSSTDETSPRTYLELGCGIEGNNGVGEEDISKVLLAKYWLSTVDTNRGRPRSYAIREIANNVERGGSGVFLESLRRMARRLLILAAVSTYIVL